MKSGIYTIENLVNGKLYVGCAVNFKSRWNTHKDELRHNRHTSDHLQKAWNKYGEKNFKFEILEEWSHEYLLVMEHYWCNLLNVHNDKYGYNIQPTHPYGAPGHAEETKEKLRNLGFKPVVVLDKSGNFLEELPSVRSAISKYGISVSAIWLSMKQKSLALCGFFFIKKSDYNPSIKYQWTQGRGSKTKRTPILVTEIVTGTSTEYESYIAAGKALSIYPQCFEKGAKKGYTVKDKYKVKHLKITQS